MHLATSKIFFLELHRHKTYVCLQPNSDVTMLLVKLLYCITVWVGEKIHNMRVYSQIKNFFKLDCIFATHSLSTVSFPQHKAGGSRGTGDKAGGLVTCWTTSHIERQAYINTRTHSYSFAISGVYPTIVLPIFSSQFTPTWEEVAKESTTQSRGSNPRPCCWEATVLKLFKWTTKNALLHCSNNWHPPKCTHCRK